MSVSPDETPKNKSISTVVYVAGGLLIGTFLVVMGMKVFTPAVKRLCHSILKEDIVAKGRGENAVSVEAVLTKLDTISKRVNTVGKLRANQFVTIKSEINGIIKEIHFKEGAQVEKGDLLISFKDDEIVASLHQAEAEVIQTQAEFDRYTILKERAAGSGQKYDEAKGRLGVAKGKVEGAKAKLMGTKIHAPFEGRAGLIEQSPGAYVQANAELVTVVDFDPMKVDCKIPEKYLLEIGPGQSAEVKIDTMPDQTFIATLDAIDSKVDTASHSVAVRASIPNKDGQLKVGQFASISLIVGEKSDALTVPDSALTRKGEREFVWVIISGKAQEVPVITGTREKEKVEIISGLREGLLIVTAGQINLSDGAPVKIMNMKPEEIAAAEKQMADLMAAAKKRKGLPAEEMDDELPEEGMDSQEPVQPVAPTAQKAPEVTQQEAPVAATPAAPEAPKTPEAAPVATSAAPEAPKASEAAPVATSEAAAPPAEKKE